MGNFGSLNVYKGGRKQILELVQERIFVPNRHFHFLAASSVNAAFEDEALLEVFNTGISIPDSRPLAFLMSLIGEKTSNFRGADFMRYAIENDKGDLGHFMIGASQSAIDSLKVAAIGINPQFRIAGSLIPEVKDSFKADYDHWYSKVKESGADIVWIGLSTPKQDFVASDLARMSGLSTIAVGAAFGFISGTLPEAPMILRLLGLEWAFRLASEPQRLWKRYLLGNARFLFISIKIVKTRVIESIKSKSLG